MHLAQAMNTTNNIQANNNKEEKKNMFYGRYQNYNLIQPIGDSHLYPVYLAQHQDTNETVVIKTMDLKDESYANEAMIFGLGSHKHIIECKETIENTEAEFSPEVRRSNKFNNTNGSAAAKNAVVMEHAENGDFFNFLVQGPLSESITRYYFEQLLSAIEHLHSHQYCHLDIKLENILLDGEFNVKLTDFGFATQIQENKKLFKKVGTPGCRPPEMWKLGTDFKGYDGAKTDVFQLGVLLYIFLTGMPPFSEANYADLWYRPAIIGRWDAFWSFKERAMKTRKNAPKSFSNDFKALITEMLTPESDIRPTLDEIRESSWFKNTRPATQEEVMAEMKKRREQAN